MKTSSIRRVGVLGCGLMGAGIAEVCARAGADDNAAGRRLGADPRRRRSTGHP